MITISNRLAANRLHYAWVIIALDLRRGHGDGSRSRYQQRHNEHCECAWLQHPECCRILSGSRPRD
jgi:hypothetical protein